MDRKGEILVKSSNEVEWKIADFFLLPEAKHCWLYSPSFPYLGEVWRFLCYPNEISVLGIHIGLLVVHPVSSHNVSFRFGIKQKEGLEYISRMQESIVSEDAPPCVVRLHVDRAFLKKHKSWFAHGDEISFFCIFPSGPSKDAVSQTIRSKGADKLLENIEELFLNEGDHDIIIKVKGTDFPAHKLIIVVRCPFFRSMFSHDMIEKNTGVIKIEDCEPQVFREFLYFLYSGKLKNVSDENVIGLYVIADMYRVDELKSECLEFMMRNISDENFCDFISLALRHSERDLLNFATNYFVKNLKTIIVTVKWQSFYKEYPIESNELYIKAINHPIPD